MQTNKRRRGWGGVAVALALALVVSGLGGCVPVAPVAPVAPIAPAGSRGMTNYDDLQLNGALVFEGATVDGYKTTVSVTDPTAARAIVLPNSSGTVALNPYGASIEFEGATANDYETTLTVVDPTADATLTLPAETGAVVVSSLATNGTGITNSVTGASNALIFEGATADAFQTALSATDPTTPDKVITLPDATGTVMLSTLATNGPGAANAVTGGSNALIFEGSAVDAYEMTVSATNPTAARSVVLPDAGGTVMLSSLATNAATITNSVTGGSNVLIFEGVTADAYQTSLTIVDPTAANTITFPNSSGYPTLSSTAPDGVDAWWFAGQDLKHEGSTANEFEAIVRMPADPTADNIYSLPAFSGYVATTSASGLQLVYGSSTITGTLAVTHGLTTPLYALCTLAADPVADAAYCSTLISGSTVTVKVWKSDAITITAGSVGVLVDWTVVGTP